ncbi:MAG: L-aspartate oxidase, partial [Gammaproteobacteria bacterium]|nr:L-aspartate oxidase [Gammaproteobacteria bacterium]
TTGIHGANRLASNSLLEALVYARRVARELDNEDAGHDDYVAAIPAGPIVATTERLNDMVDATRKIMSRYVGILRNGSDLDSAYDRLSVIGRQIGELIRGVDAESPPAPDTIKRWAEARNLVLVARLVTFAALRREESRGAHYRDDYPLPRPEWRHQQSLTVDTLLEAH